MNGFKVNKLILTGENVESKSVTFKKGLNVLVGPSNTGKTYVFQCIDFVLGRSKPPKKLKLSKSYEYAYLEIEEYSSGEISTISRSLLDSSYLFYQNTNFSNIDKVDPIPLDEKLSKKENISSLILKICGFEPPIKIKKNQNLATVNFSFRHFANFILIKEDVMISERSPIYTGSYTDRTLCLNAFKFLLTNNDDSSLKKTEKREVWSAKKDASINLLQKLLEEETEKLSVLEQKKNEYLGVSFNKQNAEQLESIQKQISIVNEELSEKENLINRIQSDIIYNENLKYKFSLLKDQYLSDIERLQFIDEGSFLLNQLNVTKCPHCGEDLSDVKQHNHKDIDMSLVNEACDYEVRKIHNNLLELEKTTQTVNDIIDSLQKDLRESKNALEESKVQLQEILQPKLTALNEAWNSSLEYEVAVSKIDSANKQIAYLQSLITDTSSEKHIPNLNTNQEIIKIVNDSIFPKLLEKNLKRCLFVEDTSLPIIFYMNNDNELDFLINGEERETFGKGYRSIITSIFHATLIIYCQEKGHPHLNLLVLDSPINAFKDLEANEKLPESVQSRFFEFLTENFSDKQLIVIENDLALDDLAKNTNIIEFTRNKNLGRYGFF